MQSRSVTFTLSSHTDTHNLAALIADHAAPGLCILLEGDIGAGKTYLARSIIQTLLAKDGQHGDVPSPTFTLVQVYETGSFETWHADLYRLSTPDEVVELGLEDAFSQAFCLIEWPDRMGDLAPPDAVRLTLAMTDQPEHRNCTVSAPSGPLAKGLARFSETLNPVDRADQRQAFLAETEWADADISPVAGDASNRRYDRLTTSAGARAILMDAPIRHGEDVTPFLNIATYLTQNGLSAPAIVQHDTRSGFVLMEDLGDNLIARMVARDPSLEVPLYKAIVDSLVALQALAVPSDLPAFDAAAMQEAALLPLDWYLGRTVPVPTAVRAKYESLMEKMLGQLSPAKPVLIHRDFHAENLLWLPDRDGVRRIGILDFQDAMLGHPAYDLASLLSDARRDVSADTRKVVRSYFATQTGFDPAQLERDLAILSAQRNLRILGVFARLCQRDGKSHYASLAPRVWDNLRQDLGHPDLAEMSAFAQEHFPRPASTEGLQDA